MEKPIRSKIERGFSSRWATWGQPVHEDARRLGDEAREGGAGAALLSGLTGCESSATLDSPPAAGVSISSAGFSPSATEGNASDLSGVAAAASLTLR